MLTRFYQVPTLGLAFILIACGPGLADYSPSVITLNPAAPQAEISIRFSGTCTWGENDTSIAYVEVTVYDEDGDPVGSANPSYTVDSPTRTISYVANKTLATAGTYSVKAVFKSATGTVLAEKTKSFTVAPNEGGDPPGGP